MIHIPTIIFGQTTPVDFYVNGQLAVRLLDVSPAFGLMIRYTTFKGYGMMSVYSGQVMGDPIVADSDRTILCDEHGNPTQVTGIQRYMPASVFCPAYLEPGELWWRRTEGDWLWHPGDNYPDAPPLGRYRHDNAWHIDDGMLIHAEEFSYLTDGEWCMEYRRGFAYEIETRRLLQFTDHMDGRVYERA